MTRITAVAAGLVLVSAVSLLVWNEARKEIKFLCGNFASGVTEQSVVNQLDTGEFLRYAFVDADASTAIMVDSAYNLGLYRCEILLNQEGRVISARYGAH